MATIIQRDVIVGPDGKIEMSAPELAPRQHVTVSIQTDAEPESQSEKRNVIDIVKDFPGHCLFKTAEEVDAYIREERDSWER